MSQPLSCAHRGLSASHPENTLEAFQAAAAANFDGIEMDVRATHDGIPVVMHDANIARTTDGVGRVSDFDLDELRTHNTAAGVIPTLEEALTCAPDWTGLWNLEIKAAKALEPTLELIAKLALQARSLVTAMDPDLLLRARDKAPDIPRGLITLGRPDLDDLEAAESSDASWMMVDHDFLTDAVSHQAREAGLKVGAWTVNSVDEAEALVSKVDMVITDTLDVKGVVDAS